VSGMSVGTITGTFVLGETITGGTSGATGRVAAEYSGAGVYLKFVVTSGATAFTATDGIVGSTSGATCSFVGPVEANQGFEWRPVSDNVPSATAALFMDGLKKPIKGARGNVAIEATVGEPVFLNFSFSGVYQDVADEALLTGIDYDDPTPKPFLCVGMNVGGLTATFASLNVDIQNDVQGREDANDCNGYKSFIIVDRSPQATMDPEMELVATHDFYGRLLANTAGRFSYELGSSTTPGEHLVVNNPRFEYSDVGEGERTGLQVADVTLALTAATPDAGDDELAIYMI